jgi:HEAT repeat protein
MRWWTLTQLNSRNASVRASAIEKIGKSADSSAFQALSQALRDPSASVRKSTASALGSMPPEGAIPLLSVQLNDPEPEVRLAVVKALHALGSEAAQSALVAALEDVHGETGWHAAQFLKSKGWQPATESEAAAWCVGAGDFESAAAYGSPAIPTLSKISREGAFHRAIRAVEALARINDPQVIKPILECLKGEDATIRSAAASALGQIGDARAVGPLLNALRDENSSVCLAVCSSLGKLSDQSAVGPLQDLLQHRGAEVRAAALEALGKLRDVRAVPAIIPLLRDPDSDVRENAAICLGVLRDERGIEPLTLTLIDPQKTTREAAARALQLINGSWESAPAAQNAIPALQLALKSRDYWVRYSAADVLNKLGKAQSRESPLLTSSDGACQKQQNLAGIFFSMLSDSDSEFRQAAAEALGRISLPGFIPHLVERLSDKARAVQSAAGRTLETLGWQPENAAQKASWLVVLEKWSDAAALGVEAIVPLASALEWRETASRCRAIEALVRIGDARVLPALEKTSLDEDKEVREEALAAIAALSASRTAPDSFRNNSAKHEDTA